MTTQNTDTEHDSTIDALMESNELLRDKLALSEAHHKKLAEELPKMRADNQRLMAFFQDAAAFCRGAGFLWDEKTTLTTLIHDIMGIANDERCFVPRVTGYAQRERERKL